MLIAEDLAELHPIAPEALSREVFDEEVGEAKQREKLPRWSQVHRRKLGEKMASRGSSKPRVCVQAWQEQGIVLRGFGWNNAVR